jgi:hypothetical protein
MPLLNVRSWVYGACGWCERNAWTGFSYPSGCPEDFILAVQPDGGYSMGVLLSTFYDAGHPGSHVAAVPYAIMRQNSSPPPSCSFNLRPARH